MWPGVSKLMNWHEYPQWRPQSLSTAVPNLDKDGLNLLAVIKQEKENPSCFSSWFILHQGTNRWKNPNYLVQQMLQYEPSKRISAKKAMEHPYFDDVNKAHLWRICRLLTSSAPSWRVKLLCFVLASPLTFKYVGGCRMRWQTEDSYSVLASSIVFWMWCLT